VFRLRLRSLAPAPGSERDALASQFLQATGFLGSDSPRLAERQRALVGRRLFTRCLLPHPEQGWTTGELATALEVPVQAVYRHLQWLRELGLLTEDFPGKADDPKRVRLWHHSLSRAWEGVELHARACLTDYRDAAQLLAGEYGASGATLPEGMLAVEKEDHFDIELREVPPSGDAPAKLLARLGEGVGYFSAHHYPIADSMPFRILDGCFLQRPDRAWTAEEVAAWAETTRPTAYRHINKLLSLGMLARCRAADGGPPASAFHLRGGSLATAWQAIETRVELVLDSYRRVVGELA
jgi:predicted transcriptional regulator